MFPQLIVRSTAEIGEFLEPNRGFISCVDDVCHVGGQHEGRPVPLDGAKHLSVSQDTAKVYVEHVTRLADHDVVIVAVTDAKDVCSNAEPCTRVSEVLDCLKDKEKQMLIHK